jgi:outer membrane protein insertion porin family
MDIPSRHELTSYLRIYSVILGLLSFGAILTGCAGIKNPPKGVPYVYNNDIVLRSEDVAQSQKVIIKEKLLLNLDDSLKVQTVNVLGRTRRVNPPVYDTVNIERSIRLMNGYLNSIGYYNAQFDSVLVKRDLKPEKNEVRVSNTFFITLGRSLEVDTLIYRFQAKGLQHIADSLKPFSALLPGALYSKEKVAVELDRLSAEFRQRGYMRISRSSMFVEADTTDPVLININASPVEQVISAVKRKQKPVISLMVQQRPGVDSAIFLTYFIDSIVLFPQASISKEMNEMMRDSAWKVHEVQNRFLIKSIDDKFSKRMLAQNVYLKPGMLYNENLYFKTLNAFSQMGPWEQVDGRSFNRLDSVPLTNLHFFLYPARKQSFQVDLEGSQNNNISVSNALAGRFLALSVNATHRNRNVFRSGVQSTTTATAGFELNNTQNSTNPNFFQTFIFFLGQKYTLPKLIKPFNGLERDGKVDFGRTNINLGAFYTERFNFFQQTSVNTNLQWEWRKGRNTTTFVLPNFETVFLDPEGDSLNKVIAQNPALQYAFAEGNILSTRMAIERALKYKKPNHAGFFRISGELALPPGFKLFNKDFFSFLVLQGQYVQGIRLNQSSLHYRLYSGVGWNLAGTQNGTLPFFRQFVAGGNNSMRAWVLRQLGLGNSLVSDTATFTDRFGDIQLEANIEHRFRLFRFFGYTMQGATFIDMGNIWNHTNNVDGSGRLTLGNLYRDLALNAGFGIRWDLSYLVLRLDAAYKVKDPVREGAGWMTTFEWRGNNRLGGFPRSNVGVQFGIGYPF